MEVWMERKNASDYIYDNTKVNHSKLHDYGQYYNSVIFFKQNCTDIYLLKDWQKGIFESFLKLKRPF